VLRLIARLNVGGPARHVIILDGGLRRRGFDTLLVHGAVGTAEGSLAWLADERGLPTRQIRGFGRAISLWDDVLAFGKIVALIWRWHPDIIHTHTAKAGALGRLAAFLFNLLHRRRKRCAVLHTFHGHVFTGYFGAAGSAVVRSTERALALITDRIVTISPAQEADLVRTFRVAPARKVVVIPLGLELQALLARTPEWRGMRKDLGYSANDYVIGYVGRLVPVKDLSTLLRGVADAVVRFPRLRLLIAGDGEERTGLTALAADLGLSERVRFLGWQSDLASLYASMDLFVLTSINEGTPVSLIEAMAAGVPSIATAVGGVPDVIEHGVTGTLIPPKNVDALSATIEQAMTSNDMMSTMASRARIRVANMYDAARLVRDIELAYREELSRRRGVTASYEATVGSGVAQP
jgi:glycosyltransferase involved in cell wall biosynthesis